jgi:hypothetical protein
MLRRVQCVAHWVDPSQTAVYTGSANLQEHAGVGRRFDCVVGGMNSSKAQLPVNVQVTHTVNY